MQLKGRSLLGALAGAATALGLGGLSALGNPAAAQSAPTEGEVSFKLLDYQDWQPGLKRIHVRAPSLGAVVPLNERWSVQGSVVTDAISGASPAYYSVVDSAAEVIDRRNAADLRLNRHFTNTTVSVGGAWSREDDYISKAVSLTLTHTSQDRNTTWTAGIGRANDTIRPVTRPGVSRDKTVADMLLGWTQVLTPVDIVQLNLTHASGKGYFSDPYKLLDVRPDRRRQTAVLARWNHHVRGVEGTMRLGWRVYHDSFGIRAHTGTMEWVQAVGPAWTVTPLLRLHRQNQADFYSPPNPSEPDAIQIPPGVIPGRSLLSFDQRLSAFRAQTVGAKVAWSPTPKWTVDLRWERYRQRSDETPFDARFTQFGITYRF